MNRFKKPRFIHDCDNCLFLGQYDQFDCWYCPESKSSISGGSVIMRSSDDGPDYCSYDLSTAHRIALSPISSSIRHTSTFEALLACLRTITETELVKVKYRVDKRKSKDYKDLRKMLNY